MRHVSSTPEPTLWPGEGPTAGDIPLVRPARDNREVGSEPNREARLIALRAGHEIVQCIKVLGGSKRRYASIEIK